MSQAPDVPGAECRASGHRCRIPSRPASRGHARPRGSRARAEGPVARTACASCSTTACQTTTTRSPSRRGASASRWTHLAAEGHRVVDLVEALDAARGGRHPAAHDRAHLRRRLRRPARHALPVLERHGFRATVFVTTGVTDGRLTFPWYETRQPPVLGWDDVVRARSPGDAAVRGAHGLAPEPARARRRHGRRRDPRLPARAGGAPRPARCRPSPIPPACSATASAGWSPPRATPPRSRCEPGVNRPETDRFALRRRQIDRRDRLIDFKAKVGGGHDTPLPLRDAYRRMRYGMVEESPRRSSSRT